MSSNFPPPPRLPPGPGHVPPPLGSMPPPVPGTGANSQYFSPQVQHFMPAPAHPYVPHADKSLGLAYLLWFFLGWLGVHHYYLGKVGRGVGYTLTFAWFTIGWWIDLFTLPAQVKRINFELQMGMR